MKNRSTNNTIFSKRGILIILFTTSVCFSFTIFLPFYEFYYLNEQASQENMLKTVLIYGNKTEFAFFYSMYFLFVVLGITTFNKRIVHIINILGILAVGITLAVNGMLFAFWGASPIHPAYLYGYKLCVSGVLLMVIFGYLCIPHFKKIEQKKWIFNLSLILIFAIPLSIFIYIKRVEYIRENAPHCSTMTTGTNENGKYLKSEDWDWKGENVRYYKYYTDVSINKDSNSFTNTWVLDSIKMNYYTDFDKNEIIKTVTKKAINGELDINEFIQKE